MCLHKKSKNAGVEGVTSLLRNRIKRCSAQKSHNSYGSFLQPNETIPQYFI